MLGAHLSGRMWSAQGGPFPSLHRTEQGLSAYEKVGTVTLQSTALLLQAFVFGIRSFFSSEFVLCSKANG